MNRCLMSQAYREIASEPHNLKDKILAAWAKSQDQDQDFATFLNNKFKREIVTKLDPILIETDIQALEEIKTEDDFKKWVKKILERR